MKLLKVFQIYSSFINIFLEISSFMMTLLMNSENTKVHFYLFGQWVKSRGGGKW